MDTSSSGPLFIHFKDLSFVQEKKSLCPVESSPPYSITAAELLSGVGSRTCLSLSCLECMYVLDFLADGRMEMFNLNCKLINFIHHLKERCGVDSKECVDLMDSRGKVMNLAAKQHSLALASSVLGDRQHYVLLQVCRDDEAGGQKYVSLQNNHRQSHPELTELLRKLTDKAPDRKIRKGRTPRSKNISANSKSH